MRFDDTHARILPREKRIGYLYLNALRTNLFETRENGGKISDGTSDEIGNRLGSLGRISTGIAHEIRNPLSIINVYAQTLRSMVSGFEDKKTLCEILDEIESASERIEGVVNSAIDFARQRKPEFVLSDINHCIREAVAFISLTLGNEDILMETDLGSEIPELLLENRSMTQVFVNLISNGAEAMRNSDPPKQLSISSRLGKDAVVISISDSGPGIAPENLEKIFDPFFTTKRTGLGIGLSLCDRIVSDHDGVLTVSSNRCQGAEFRITLPLTNSR